MKLEKGQKVYLRFSSTRGSDLTEALVDKVGRKWVTFTVSGRIRDWKANVGSSELDGDGNGYASPGRIYLSIEDYEKEVALSDAWTSFRRAVDREYRPPTGASLEGIKTALDALGLKIDEEKK